MHEVSDTHIKSHCERYYRMVDKNKMHFRHFFAALPFILNDIYCLLIVYRVFKQNLFKSPINKYKSYLAKKKKKQTNFDNYALPFLGLS